MPIRTIALAMALAVSLPAVSLAQDAAPSKAEQRAAAKAAKEAEKAAKAAEKARLAEARKKGVDPDTGEKLVCWRESGGVGTAGGVRICKTQSEFDRMNGKKPSAVPTN